MLPVACYEYSSRYCCTVIGHQTRFLTEGSKRVAATAWQDDVLLWKQYLATRVGIWQKEPWELPGYWVPLGSMFLCFEISSSWWSACSWRVCEKTQTNSKLFYGGISFFGTSRCFVANWTLREHARTHTHTHAHTRARTHTGTDTKFITWFAQTKTQHPHRNAYSTRSQHSGRVRRVLLELAQ